MGKLGKKEGKGKEKEAEERNKHTHGEKRLHFECHHSPGAFGRIWQSDLLKHYSKHSVKRSHERGGKQQRQETEGRVKEENGKNRARK